MLDYGANVILKKLNSAGYQCYVVGGAVRDFLLGENPVDYDFTTDAEPQEIKRVFSEFKQVDIGFRHGTIGVVIDDKNYEITTFRIDGEYINNRKPNNIILAKNLLEDLKRRDFTINALCFHPELGIIDYFNGEIDLKNKIIRAIGEPKTRFTEDALRILRAVRFSAKLGFEIENQTKIALDETKHLLKNISAERIYSEFKQLICGKHVKKACLEYKNVIFEIIPELKVCDGFDQNSLSHSQNVYEHILTVVENCEQDDEVLRFAALFHDIGKPFSFTEGADGHRHFYGHWNKSAEIAKQTLTRLKSPKNIVEQVVNLCLVHDEDLKTKYEIKKLLRLHGVDFFVKLLAHKLADVNAHSPYGIKRFYPFYSNTKKLFDEIIKEGECYNLSMLNFNGEDAIKLGYKNNGVGEIIEELFDLVISDKLANDKEDLINYARHKIL